MLNVNDQVLLDDAYTVLVKLKEDVLLQTGKDYFKNFIIKNDNIQFCCPVHKGGQEQKPSCGMTTNTKQKSDGTFITAGTVHCFTCGYTASLPQMISYVFGKDDGGIFGIKWLVKNFAAVEIENRRDLRLDLDRNKQKEKITYVSEDELDLYRYYHPYMYQRGLTDEIIEKYDVGYDCKFRLKEKGNTFPCITFPVRDKTGNTLFIVRRAIDFKLYHYPENAKKPLYGIYELDDMKELIVCESVLNALTAVKYGRNAIALLGTGSKEQYEEISKLPCRKIITAFDGDDAGRAATIRFKKNVENKLIKTLVIPEGKDVNDLSEEEFKKLREIF